MPKRSEAINRRTDNTMDKRKKAKGQTTICKTLHSKLKIEQHELWLFIAIYIVQQYSSYIVDFTNSFMEKTRVLRKN
jgi:hypothetical protein